MDEILDNYELFIMVFLVLIAITYAIFTFVIKEDTELIHKSLLHRGETDIEEPDEVDVDVITEEDRALFVSLRSFLPLDGETIKFLENHNMEKSFHGSMLDSLYAFYYDGNSENKRFPNKKLDKERNRVATLAGNVVDHFSKGLTLMEKGQVIVKKDSQELDKKIKKFTDAYRAFADYNMLK